MSEYGEKMVGPYNIHDSSTSFSIRGFIAYFRRLLLTMGLKRMIDTMIRVISATPPAPPIIHHIQAFDL
jgi:hypothetical protein